MANIRSLRLRNKQTELNMTPLIDMVFILLIFFIVTTSFVKEAGVEINRPMANTAVTNESTSLVIGITQSNEVWIEGKIYDVRSIRGYMNRFLAETPEGAVVIAADKECKSGLLIKVLDACREAGAANLSVAARNPA
ncbi:ExbD/TolR family protein [Halodesulfovibrio aestuarii]|uniref:ExbD/TolR family protein n=1 Tax=Halodesulfovibrio aestuarii TaxID=126333 RepID=A0A8G2CBI9_9BACT|nr:biopolymer transporter ExbD [Halodesulfovibrio aestuarii]SHJ56278.1 outer membrane transport energization protein ExbD [Halodesulfovibrio aestuarii]